MVLHDDATSTQSRRLGTEWSLVLHWSIAVAVTVYGVFVLVGIGYDDFEDRCVGRFISLQVIAVVGLCQIPIAAWLLSRRATKLLASTPIVVCVFLAIATVAWHRFDCWRNWFFSYGHEFQALSYWEYQWCVGRRAPVVTRGANSISFAVYRGPSANHMLWKMAVPEKELPKLFRRNERAIEGIRIAPRDPEEYPEWFTRPRPKVQWWTPPEIAKGLSFHHWIDESRYIWAYSLYDPRTKTLWIRR